MKKVAVIHTSLAINKSVDAELKRAIPGVEIHNIIDEQMLNEVIRSGGITPQIVGRMCKYVDIASGMGVDAILNACSSVGEAFDIARRQTDLPTMRIDEPMAREAVETGSRIAVYGTVATTLAPSCALIERMASEMGRSAQVTPYLIDGAFQVLAQEGGVEKHNRMVLDKILETHAAHDVLVLAQASMAVLIPQLGELGKPVLYSLVSGVDAVRRALGE